MTILGIDPGIAVMGYGAIELINNISKMIAVGVIKTSNKMSLDKRLIKLYQEITILLDKHKPNEVAIESLFFSTNKKTALIVSEARGVIMLALAKANLNIFEYNPLQVKQGITGFGKASKEQVGNMVRLTLNLKETPKPDDAADALAIAVCHANRNNSFSKACQTKA